MADSYEEILEKALNVARARYRALVRRDVYGATHRSFHAVEALLRAEKYMQDRGFDFTFGTEGMSVPENDFSDSAHSLTYLNAGDTYTSTLLWDGQTEEFSVGCWGDWMEGAEQDREEETDTYRCGYCGEYTDKVEGVEWHDTVCESCGHCVDGSEAPVPCQNCGEDDCED